MGWAALPNPHIYDWGHIEVPENYSFASSQKIKIYWEKLKSTSQAPEAIIMINGGPGSTHDGFHREDGRGGYLKDWFYALRTNYDIYYFDQRGNGESAPLAWDVLSRHDIRHYGTENICRDIEELRKRVIRKEKIAVLGESYGGMVALSYAIMYPQQVAKLVIHDSSPSNNYFTHMHKNFSDMLSVLDLKIPGIKANLVKSVEMFDAGEVTNAHNVSLSGFQFLNIIMNYTYSVRGQMILGYMVDDIVRDGRSDILDAIIESLLNRSSRNAFLSLPPTLLVVQALEMLDEAEIARAKAGAAYSPWSFSWMNDSIHQPRRDFKSYVRLEEFRSFNVIPRLSQIVAPTLVIVGETDFICPPVFAEIMKNGIGDKCRMLRVRTLPTAGLSNKTSSLSAR
jgi:pimeloyl-ACP methyl ester carboxylesterase